jgi:hypothetical protein
MPSFGSVFGPGNRILARHLSRLGETLESFAARLRDAVSSAVGETVSGIVRETVRAVLDHQQNAPPASGRNVRSPQYRRPAWEMADDPREGWYDDPDDYPPEDDRYDDPPVARTGEALAPSRLPRAIAIGLHTTLRWLRRGVGRWPVITAIAVGLLTALAAYAGGPLAAAGAFMAGSAFDLLSLAELIHTGAEALTPFASA